MTTSVLGSRGAELRLCTMSVIDLIVPFLGQLSQSIVLNCKISGYGETNILKFPPTKNWRPMIASEMNEFEIFDVSYR